MANFFKKLFYTPNYISMPAAGIAVSNNALIYMEFLNKNGLVFIKNYGEVPLIPNTLRDGDILNKDAFQKALAIVKTKISSDFVRVSIPEEATYIFDTQIPNMKDSDIRQALEFKLEENVPLKADEVFFEYEVIKNNRKSFTSIPLSVSVIPKKIITNFTEAFDAAGIYPLAFEMESRMTTKSLAAKRDNKKLIIIHIKNDSTVMSFVVDGIVHFTSTLPIGDKNLIESFKKDIGNIEFQDIDQESVYSMYNIFSVIKDEVEKFHQYVISKAQDKNSFETENTVDQIVLCGRSVVLPGFINYIAQGISTEVVFGNVWTNVFNINDYLPPLKFEESLRFATAVGLALPNNKR
jgi:type IV pilus assembly protein PilM